MIGVDEVGRGAWAGPLLVAAFRAGRRLPAGLTDSKLLTARRRQGLVSAIQNCGDCGLGWVSAAEIDWFGLAEAMRLGVERALLAIRALPDEPIIIDGKVNYCPKIFTDVTTIVKADQTVEAVSAASVLAKVARDAHMADQALAYPDYGFDSHVGYGTAGHSRAIQALGICKLHRLSFKPVKLAIDGAL